MTTAMNGAMDSAAGTARRGGRRECGVCWHVYDPAEGDPVWQVAPGTPFAELPAHWSCPNCGSELSKFLVLADE